MFLVKNLFSTKLGTKFSTKGFCASCAFCGHSSPIRVHLGAFVVVKAVSQFAAKADSVFASPFRRVFHAAMVWRPGPGDSGSTSLRALFSGVATASSWEGGECHNSRAEIRFMARFWRRFFDTCEHATPVGGESAIPLFSRPCGTRPRIRPGPGVETAGLVSDVPLGQGTSAVFIAGACGERVSPAHLQPSCC